MSYQQDQIDEIQARTRRTETMVFTMHEQMTGPKDPPIKIREGFIAEVAGYDVTLSQIRRAMAMSGCANNTYVEVRMGDIIIAEIEFRG